MRIIDCEQNTPEWHQARLGIPTASEFSRIITPTGKISTQADAYMDRLLAEWILGAPLETQETQWMERGHELESRAYLSYEFERNVKTQPVGFCITDDGMIGASPDRLVGNDGLLELKCPAPNTHVGYMRRQHVDQTYMPQCQGQLFVTGRQWVDIQSYHPGLPTVIRRVYRNEKFLVALEDALNVFVAELLKAREALTAEFGPFERHAQTKPLDVLDVSDEDVTRIIELHRKERTQTIQT